MPIIIPDTLHVFFNLIFVNNFMKLNIAYTHFTEEETSAQRACESPSE